MLQRRLSVGVALYNAKMTLIFFFFIEEISERCSIFLGVKRKKFSDEEWGLR